MHRRSLRVLSGCLGVAALAATMAVQAYNDVQNGDFETGDFTGWTQFGDTTFTGVDTFAPQAGTYAAYFGPTSPGGIDQTIATSPGQGYVVSFWLQTEADVNGVATPNFFEFNWDGGPAELTIVNAPASPYTQYSFRLVASSSSTDLRFTFSDTPAFLDFDSVSVIPEPGSLALLGLAGGIAALARRRRAA